ncbi:alpha/beta hydrolase [Agromyces sp. SYSU K20354]|uniref:RBBP9/YdeN family alpha/beta hydrolase n=1 Tax=Agromyces cavernae TaxID=2898659 RepID=UPI001E4D5291|nr:alpha/beta hydrolase [Agromyces cavernae]MCD2442718.1 alpha/beta hydrolase [Agromyces cavernae]
MTHLIVPGIGGSGPAHWQTLWERDLSAVRIDPSSWEEPRLDDWLAALDRASDEVGPGAVIIAHSMGCLAAAEWVALDPSRASAVLLVAPPDPDGPRYPVEAFEFARIGRHPLAPPTLVVASEDDPYGTRAYAAALAETWGAGFVSVGPLGHINADSGIGAWPEGRELLDDLVAVARRVA